MKLPAGARTSILMVVGLLVAATASCSRSSTGLLGAVTAETTTTAVTARTATARTAADQAATANTDPTAVGATPAAPQVGLNFIRFFWTDGGRRADSKGSAALAGPAGSVTTAATVQPRTEPDAIFRDFSSLGVQAYRQSVKADLLWDIVEPRPGEWHFDQADTVLRDSSTQAGVEPIVTLFAMQYASPTPPWADSASEFQTTLGPEARTYLETVVRRYAPYVTYWELGNEMAHWRIAEPGANRGPTSARAPAVMPADGYSPQQQGAFLAQAAEIIRKLDPDAVIVLPGMGGLDPYDLNTWLPGVIEGGGGSDWFDVVNYHYYPSWATYVPARERLDAAIERLGLGEKPVWMTESGSSASPTLTKRTDYPNDAQSQAADVFRRLVQSWGEGDSLALWHTYIGSGDSPDNDWRLYGLVSDDGTPQPSYYAFRLLTTELVPFERVEQLAAGGERGANVYRVTTRSGDVRYVVWGSGAFSVPDGVTRMTGVASADGGVYVWQAVQAGQTLALAQEPMLLV